MIDALVFVLIGSISLTVCLWVYAFGVAVNEEFNKKNAQLILALIFWPIGFVIVIVRSFSKLFKTAFGKEEK
jgi:hypothetical protein